MYVKPFLSFLSVSKSLKTEHNALDIASGLYDSSVQRPLIYLDGQTGMEFNIYKYLDILSAFKKLSPVDW